MSKNVKNKKSRESSRVASRESRVSSSGEIASRCACFSICIFVLLFTYYLYFMHLFSQCDDVVVNVHNNYPFLADDRHVIIKYIVYCLVIFFFADESIERGSGNDSCFLSL